MSEPLAAADFLTAAVERRLPAVVDDPEVEALLAAAGFSTIAVDDYAFGGPPALFVPRRFATHDALFEAWDEAPGIRAHYSLARHRTDPAYGLAHLLGLDVPATLERRRALWSRIDDSAAVHIDTDGARLTCHFGAAVEAARPDETIEEAGNDGLGDFVEAAVVNMETPTSSFRAEGALRFDGLVWLCNSDGLEEATADVRDRWLARAARGDNRARFDGGRLVELRLGGVDATAELRALTRGKEREAAANELGFGAAVADVPVEVGGNARMHRGRSGVFIGFGAGHLIPHVDLWVERPGLTWA